MVTDEQRFLSTPGYRPYVAAAAEAGNVMAWRHVEVLHHRLTGRGDYRQFAQAAVCAPTSREARVAVLAPFALGDHNPAVMADTGEMFQGGSAADAILVPDYHYRYDGELRSALLFLVVVDLWEQDPVVRRMYRGVSNSDTTAENWQKPSRLYYDEGAATAENELIMKLRLHFSNGGRAVLADRARQNTQRFEDWEQVSGPMSSDFVDGHLELMAPRVCAALTNSLPGTSRSPWRAATRCCAGTRPPMTSTE